MGGLINLGRPVDLSLEADRAHLRACAQSDPEFSELVAKNLDNYLGYFPGADLRAVSPGGGISVSMGPSTGQGFSLGFALSLARDLSRLSSCPGFPQLVAEFKNGPQVRSAVFELTCATWCLDRGVHKSLYLFPEVLVGGKRKRPEFLWSTQLGEIYCECKSMSAKESELAKQVTRLMNFLEVEWREIGKWPAGTCLDVHVTSLDGNVYSDMRAAVNSVHSSLSDQPDAQLVNEHGNVCARLIPSAELPPKQEGWARQARVEVNQTPREIFRNCYLALNLSHRGHLQRLVRNLLADARRQIPESGPGAVFIEIHSDPNPIANAILPVLENPDYERIAAALLWCGAEPAWMSHRKGQPFNTRLLEAAPGTVPPPNWWL